MSVHEVIALPRPATPGEVRSLLETERVGLPFLVYRDGGTALRIRPLGPEPSTLTIGRDPSCAVPIGWDGRVSRAHAVLERLAQAWTVADDGISRNGTYLNAARLSARRRLVDGDTVRVGATLLLFRDPVAADLGATNTAESVVAAPITPAQRNVLIALCRPMLLAGESYAPPASNTEIATELVVSVDAVKSHMRALFERFSVGELPQNRKRARVAELAIRSGAVTERDL